MMLIAYLLGAFVFIAGIGLTISSGWLITMAAQHPPILTLGVAIVLVRFFGIFRSVARYGERFVSHKAVFEKLTALRLRIYVQLVQHSIALSGLVNSGAAVKSLVDDVERAQEYELRIKLPGTSAVFALTAGILLGWWVRPESLLITVPVSIILLLLFPFQITRLTVPTAQHIELAENIYTQQIEASVHGVIEAQIYGYFEQSLQPVLEQERKIADTEEKLLVKSGFFSLFTNLTIAFAVVGSAWVINLISQRNPLPAVQISMLIFLPLVMFEAITMWYPNLFGSGKLLASQKAIDQILKNGKEDKIEKVCEDRIQKITCTDAVVAWGVQFMQPLSFQVAKGELLVIRGKSGVGKSTLVMGLLGLLPYKGSMKFNDNEIATFTDLNNHIVGTVQRAHVFNTTVRENLKVGNSQASDMQIMNILRLLELDSLISELPEGLDTIIGDFGRMMSGGEAKRLALARTLLADSDVYIFDEPTEHLDRELALRIERGIMTLLQEKIVIVVTHSGWADSDKSLIMAR